MCCSGVVSPISRSKKLVFDNHACKPHIDCLLVDTAAAAANCCTPARDGLTCELHVTVRCLPINAALLPAFKLAMATIVRICCYGLSISRPSVARSACNNNLIRFYTLCRVC